MTETKSRSKGNNVIGLDGQPVRKKPGPKPGYRHLKITREKQRLAEYLNQLEKIAFGEVDATPSQTRALIALLNKIIPDRKSVEHLGESPPTKIVVDTGIVRD